jgi:hypothetical protein
MGLNEALPCSAFVGARAKNLCFCQGGFVFSGTTFALNVFVF